MNELFKDIQRKANSPPNSYLQSCLDHGKHWESRGIEELVSCDQLKLRLVTSDQVSYQVKVIVMDRERDEPVDAYHLVSTPDAVVTDWQADKLIPVEIKCPKRAYDLGQTMANEAEAWPFFKINYYVQIQLQLLCLGSDLAILVIFIPPTNRAVFGVKRDREYQEYMMKNFHQAVREKDDQSKYVTHRCEKKTNEELAYQRLRSHSKLLTLCN